MTSILAPGVGMLVLGASVLAFWRLRFKGSMLYALVGGGLWLIAVLVKLLLDYVWGRGFWRFVFSLPMLEGVLVAGFYHGARTAILEGLVPYVITLRVERFRVSLRPKRIQDVGLGFGCVEAMALGVYAIFTACQVLVVNPYAAQLNPLLIPAPVIERASAIVIHFSTTVLALTAAVRGKVTLLAACLALKFVTDFVPPVFAFAGLTSLFNVYLAELIVAVIAVVSYAVYRRLAGRYMVEEVTSTP